MFLKLIYLIILLSFISSFRLGENVRAENEVQVLEQELSLAKKQNYYFLFNLQEKKIFLKSKGVLLREWEIKKFRRWGIPFSTQPVLLIKKSALFLPKREKIKPQKPEEIETFELKALELTDMPSHYTLTFNRDIRIYIRPHGKSILSTFKEVSSFFKWYSLSPLHSVHSSLKKSLYNALDIELSDKKSAQALYWALAESTQCIIFPL